MKKNDKEIFKSLALITQVGLTMIVSIGVCFLIGFFLNEYFKSKGLFLAIFIILGVFAGFWAVYKLIMKDLK